MTTTIGTAPRLAWRTMLLALVATGALAAPPADRKPPTTPTNLRVTAVGPYTRLAGLESLHRQRGGRPLRGVLQQQRQEPGHPRAGLER